MVMNKFAAERIREILNNPTAECYAACPLKYKNAATKIVNDYIFLPSSLNSLISILAAYDANDHFTMERYLIQSLANIEFDMPMDWSFGIKKWNEGVYYRLYYRPINNSIDSCDNVELLKTVYLTAIKQLITNISFFADLVLTERTFVFLRPQNLKTELMSNKSVYTGLIDLFTELLKEYDENMQKQAGKAF